MMSNRAEQGSILVAVLWSLFFLTALALVINVSVTSQLGLAARLQDRARLYYFAKAGIKRAVVELRTDETENYDVLNEGWTHSEEAFKEIALTDGGYFSLEYLYSGEEGEEDEKRYGLIDEERKVNINKVSDSVLKRFFEMVGGVSSAEATDIAAAVVDWIDEDDEPSDNGAENFYYQALDPSYPCKNAAFEVLEELLLVRGVTQEIFDKVKERLTIYTAGAVNINTADALVLQSLGMSNELVNKIILFRAGGDGQEATEDDNFFDDVQTVTALLSAEGDLSPEALAALDGIIGEKLIAVRSDYFRGRSLGSFQDRGISMEIVFVIGRDEEIRYWQEN